MKVAGKKYQNSSPDYPKRVGLGSTSKQSRRRKEKSSWHFCHMNPPFPTPVPRSTPTPTVVIELSPAPIPPPVSRATWEALPCQAPPASESLSGEPAPQKQRGYRRLRKGAPDTVIRRNSHALGRTETPCHGIFNAPPSPLFSIPSLARPLPSPNTRWSFRSFESFGHCRMRGSPGAGPANQSAVCLPWPMADATLLSNSV